MIQFNAEQIRRAEMLLGQIRGAIPKVQARAINRAAVAAKTSIVEQARKEYYVSVAGVRDKIKITNATEEKPYARIKAKGTRIELVNFKTDPNAVGKRTSVLKVAVVKGGGFKELPGAFLAKGISSGKVHVLKRTGKERYPIHIKYGISVPEMIGSNKVRLVVEERAREVLDNRLEHEINRVLEGHI